MGIIGSRGSTGGIGYGAVARFGPASGDAWWDYAGCCGIPHLEEVVSLDGSLCPNLVTELAGGLSEEDWRHNLAGEGLPHYFRDLDYFLARFGVPPDYQVLAVAKNPAGPQALPQALPDPRFEFLGYDLNEAGLQNGTSALMNCCAGDGGYEKAFRPSDLSGRGLVVSFERATRIRELLRRHYHPGDPHALCDLHAIWRMRARGHERGVMSGAGERERGQSVWDHTSEDEERRWARSGMRLPVMAGRPTRSAAP